MYKIFVKFHLNFLPVSYLFSSLLFSRLFVLLLFFLRPFFSVLFYLISSFIFMRRVHACCCCHCCCCFYFALLCFCCRLCLYLGHKFLKLKRKYSYFLYVACTMRSANAKSWKLAVKHYFWYVNRAWHAIFLLFGRLFKFRNTWLTLATTLTSRFKFLMGWQPEQQLLSLLLLSFNYSTRCCAFNYATKYNANELGAAAPSLANTHAPIQTLTQA